MTSGKFLNIRSLLKLALFSGSALEADFDDKRKLLLPTLGFCVVFFVFYYALLIVPRFGVDSTIFIIDNLGGVFIVSGFALSYWITKYFKYHFLLLVPSFMTLGTTSVFLIHQEFYQSVSHLWLSAQIIGIIFACYLGVPRWNFLLFLLNITIPPLIASQYDHLVVADIITQQAIVYFASLISIYLTYNFLKSKEELAKSRDAALMAESIKSEFLANMSHELRTPMNSVIGMLQILQRQELTSQQTDLVSQGLLSSKSLLSIINDILDFSKMESGNLTLESIDTDVVVILEEAIAEMLPIAEKKGLILEYHVAKNTNRGWLLDPVRFKQILFNLLSNAIKFTHRGRVTVTLSTDNNKLVLRVKDTGIGMSIQAQDTLFERFTQADVTTTRKFGGSGLGMAISHQIINAMDGDISVESEQGIGSLFKVVLPLQQVEVNTLSRTNENRASTPNYKGINVLLAEDNAVNQKIFASMLEPTHANLFVANDGLEAVDIYVNEKIDLCFLDIQMPNLNGIEACKQIKNIRNDVTVVAVTANVFKDDIESYFTAGFDKYLPKPLNLDALYQLMKEEKPKLNANET